MKPFQLLLSAFIFFLFFSCGPSQKITSSWVKPDRPNKHYSKVFIAAMVQNTRLKLKLEDELAAAAISKGYQVVKSADIFPPNFTKNNMANREEALTRIREKQCDVIFTVALVDKHSETRYVPGTRYMPYPGYGRGFWGYYSYWSPLMYEPGYYTTDKTYFFEANAFDTASEEMISSVQSEAYNPASIDKFSKEYTAMLVENFEKRNAQ